MATNYNTTPFGVYAHPVSGSTNIGTPIDVINFVNSSPFFTSSKQADIGSISMEYTKLSQSGSSAGASADIVFKVTGKEYADKNATEVLRVSATGSSNEARIGVGMSKYDTVDSIFHVKGEALVDGDFKIKSGSETVSISKNDLKDLLQGKAVSDSSEGKNAARGGLTQTFAANALVNLADSSTLVKANESGKLELKANNLTLVNVDATDSDEPIVDLGNKPAGKVLVTGSLDVTGSNVTFDVDDLLTLLGNFGQTGSFAVSGSSDFTGDVNMDGAVTVTDLLSVVAGINSTGSTDLSGSLNVIGDTFVNGRITGSVITAGSTDRDIFIIPGSTFLSSNPSIGSQNFTQIEFRRDIFMGFNRAGLVGGTTPTKLMFDSTDTYITANSENPEDLEIHANQDILLYPDNSVVISGSLDVSGSVTMKDVSAGGAGTYFEHSGITSGATVKIQVGDVDNLGNETKLIVDDGNETVTISGSLDITGNQVDFTNLPTSDPGVAGRLYQTASAAMGMTAGKQVVLISA
jgi:hypothetical protein